MSILQKTETPNINISSENTVLSYAHPATKNSVIVFIRADLGQPNPIVGGGIYSMTVIINSKPVAPTSAVTVDSGDTVATMQSSEVTLEPGDLLEVNIEGRPADTMTSVTAIVQDATPIRQEEFDDILGYSEVAVSVNHDYGTPNQYQYITAEGLPISDAQVLIYLKTDYDAGLRSNDYLQGVTSTNNQGQWRKSVMLDPGNYIVQFYKPGLCGPDTASLTV